MSYTDKILDIIERTKKDAETALEQSSASSASLPRREDYDSFEDYTRAKRLAKAGKSVSVVSSPGEEKKNRNPHYEEAYKPFNEGETILPNRKNYDVFSDYLRDKRLAKSGKIEFKSGAWNHGIDEEWMTSFDSEITDFLKDQDGALKNNAFGDTAPADAAESRITELRTKLKTLAEYRVDHARYLGEDSEYIKGLDEYIKGVSDSLTAVTDAWNNAKVTYIHFGNDEKAYNDALMRGRHEYDTYAEVKAALANPGRVSRMSAEELEYLSNYGLRHGYSDPAEYDKEIAELMVERNRLEEIVSNGVKEVDGGYQLQLSKKSDHEKYDELEIVESKIASLEAARDSLAESQAAWSSYTPFFNAEDFDAQSKYRGGGDLVTQYINAANDEERAELKKKLSTPHAESVDGGYKLSYSLPEDVVFTYDIMTEEEISMYNYLYNTQGKEAANVFLDTMSGLLKQRDRERDLAEITAYAKENPIIGTGVSFLTNVGSAVLAPGQLIANIVGAEDTAQKLGLLADVTGSLRGGASEYFEEDLGLGVVGKIGYGAVTSAVDMLIARKLAGLTAGAGTQKLAAGLTQAIMSSEAASATMADANRRGLNGLQVAGLGVGSAAIEWLTEKYSIEALMAKPTTAIGYWAKNVISEGSEEAVAEIAGEMLDRVIAGDKSETMKRYHELVASGMDPKEASREVLLDNLKEVGIAAATGAAAGGMQAGPAAIGYASDTRRAERRAGGVVRRTDDAQFIINEGLKAAPGTELHKLAEKAQAELKKKGKVSDAVIGKIVMEGGEAISDAYAQHNENKKYFRDSDNAEVDTGNGAVESAEDVSEAFEGAEVREAAEREKAPIIDKGGVVAGSARATTTTERRRVDISTLSKDAQVRARGVESVAKLFGKSVNFYESDAGDNGYYNRIDNSINVNVYAKNPYTVVFGHELTHGTEAAEKLYTQLQTAVERFKDKEYGAGTFSKEALTLQESRARKGKEFAVSYEGAKREVVANFISEKLFTDEATVKKFIRENRSVGQRIYEAVRAMLRKVTKGKAGYGTLKDIERIYAKALRETAKLDKARSEMIRSAEEKQQTVKEIARELGEKLHSGEITEEEYDRLFEERVASTPEFRGEVAAEARGVMGFTDSSAEGAVNQEKRFDVGEDVRALEDGGEDPEGTVYASDGNGHLQFSVSTYEEDGRDILSTYLDKQVADGALTREDADSMIRSLDLIHDTMLKYENKYASYGAWARAEVVTDDRGRPVFSVVTPNGEYAMNIDFSLVCKKRRTLDAVLNRMVSRGLIGKVILGPAQLARINEIIKDHGFEIACDMCYVDAKRYRQADVADSFVSLYNELVNAITPEGSKAVYFNFAGDTTLDTEGEGIHSLEGLDLSALDEAIQENGKRSVIGRAAAHLKANPSDRRLLSRGDFVSSAGFGSVKANNPAILKLYNAKKGAGGPKATFGDTQYLNDILSKKSFNAEKAFRVGGVRVQSYSDYVARLVFDYCQLVADMAAKGLPSHAYTKEALFAMQFGLTGMKINLSLVPKVVDGGVAAGLDESGDYAWADESFDFDTAIDIQSKEGYTENCGTIAVGVSDMHIRTLLRDPRIRMVIPYHKSSLNPVVAEMKNIDGFTNYESVQNTRSADGSALTKAQLRTQPNVNKLMHDGMSPRDAAKAYLDWCRDNGYTPKFDKFVKEDGYYKLLIDFTVFDEGGNFVPQRAVSMTFPTDESAFGSFDTLVDQGLNEDDVAEGERSESVDAIIDKIVSELGQVDESSDLQFSVAGDEDSESLARAVEAQGRELLDSYIDTEAPPEVEQEYTENNVNYPTTDYLRGRFVGYDTAADAIKALAQGRLSNKKALELAELLNMPEVANEKGEVSPIIPFRTYFIINSLGTYKRRDTGAEVPVVGYALPAADENGVWLHYYNGETKDYTNQYYTFDELTRTKAQHIATRAEWDAYLEFIEEGGKASVPENLAPTEEDLAEWRQSDNAFTVITPEQMNAAQGIYERMKPKERNNVDRAMRDFRAEVAKTLSIPMSQSGRTAIIEAGDELAADFFNNGTFGPSVIEKTFEKLFAESVVINDDFYQQYKDVLADLRSVKLLISEEDANELVGGLGAFKKKAMGLILSVSYRRDGRNGTTVDSYYGELSGSYPDLFPSGIVHPAAQLNQMLNVAREISKAKSFVEAPTEESKAAMLNEYITAVGTLGHPLSNAIKQSVESELLSAVAGDAFRSEAEEILELGTKIPGMIREIKKLQYKLLLSDHDVQVVGDLLAGYVTEEAVRKAEFNADEIIRMYEAQKPYRDATKRMQEYRARVNDNNRAIAEKVMGDIIKWDSNKKFANIMFNFMDFPRIIREIAPDEKTAELFIKTYIDPLRRESADRVRYVNEIRERVKKMGLSREIREGDKISESAAVQLLGEARAAQAMLEERMNKNKASTKQYKRDGQTLDEWRRDEEVLWEANPSFKDPTVRKRIEDAAKEFREIYDKLHHDMNRTLIDNALSPVQYRAGYFPHFEKEIDNKFITRALSFMGFAKEVQMLPTEIAGRTGDFRPNKKWFGNAMERAVNNREKQKETVLFDAVEGLDRYIETASSLIFHTTSISRFRALERYIRTATADGELKTQIERIEQSTTLSEDEKNAAIADQTRNRPFALSAFAQFLLEYTNKLAGKQSIIDRGVENLFGREVFNISKAITKKYAVNATSSLSSAFSNFLPLAQGSGGYRFWDLAGAVWDIMRNADVGDESDFVVSREGTSRLVKTGVEKWGDRARWLFENIDSFVTRSTVQARYRYNLGRKIDNEAALYEADSWARALIGDRSTGMQPLIFESNNPFIKVFSQFQLEVNNQFLRLIKDTPGEFKGRMDLHDNKAAGVADAVYHFSKAAFFTWLLNGAFEKLVGRGPGGDVLGIIFDAIAAGTGFDLFEWMFQWVPGIDEDEDDEGKGFFAGVGELFAGTAEELPFLGSVLGGGRVPIASALPDVKKLYNAFTDEDASWQYKTGTAFSELSTPLLYMVMPFGASQVKKTGQFVNDLVHGGAYAYDKEGNPKLKYPVEGIADIARGLLFGSTATTGGKEWIESGFNTLSAEQTKAYEGVVDTGVDKYTALEVVDDMRRLKPAEDAKSVTKDQKIEYLEKVELDDEAKAAIYTYIVAGKDSSERNLLLRADELGVTPGVIYRQLVGFEKIAADHKESGEDGAVADKIEQLADATVLDAAKAEIYVSVVSPDKYKELIAAGASEKDAAVAAWKVAQLLPAGDKKSVNEAQKVSEALRQGLSETEAAVFLGSDTAEKLDALAEYGVSLRGYAAVKEYLLYNDEKSATMDDVRRAINKVSNGSAVSEPGMPDVALDLSRDEKAALWQMQNASWDPEKNPYSVSVGRKVQKALKALNGDEE